MDFRLIPPQKVFDPKIAFILPCIVEEIGNLTEYTNKHKEEILYHPIKISRLNFKNGKMIMDEGIIYHKSFIRSQELNRPIPFETLVRIQLYGKVVKKIVWGVHNALTFEYFLNELPTDEREINSIFAQNYVDINSWLESEGVEYE